ncbi:hypothetical protein HMPREF0497_1054 [Lentilactobacillus buchneri ATCC 11577]|nr:hypothetical protein HMPREF0497_1054 [Lentilactobacillus buchneri ATCC 11577]
MSTRILIIIFLFSHFRSVILINDNNTNIILINNSLFLKIE